MKGGAAARYFGAALIAATVCLTDARGADPPSVGLPDVSVTAPPITPPWKKWSPYQGNSRVEEDKWPDIPCNSSRITSGATGRCKTGPPLNPAAIGLPQGNPSIQISNCRIAHDLVITSIGKFKVEADVMTFDPTYVSAIGHQHRGCFVESAHSDLRDDFPDMNQMTRDGTNWRNFVEHDDLITMEFSVGSGECRAVEKRGPRWREGYVYVIHASICRNDGRPIEAGDLSQILDGLLVRQYEANGNLRPASPE